jgi:hypothetical protein
MCILIYSTVHENAECSTPELFNEYQSIVAWSSGREATLWLVRNMAHCVITSQNKVTAVQTHKMETLHLEEKETELR